MDQSVLFALKCPSCGAPLKIKATAEVFACAYCASTVQVDRSHGAVTLTLLKDALQGVQRGTDRTASELAIRRLSDELVRLESEHAQADRECFRIYETWRHRLEPVQDSGSEAFMLILGGIMAWLSVTAVASNAIHFKSVVALISIVSAVAVTWLVLRAAKWLAVRRAESVARMIAGRDKEIAPSESALFAAMRRIEQVQASLVKHREVVA